MKEAMKVYGFGRGLGVKGEVLLGVEHESDGYPSRVLPYLSGLVDMGVNRGRSQHGMGRAKNKNC